MSFIWAHGGGVISITEPNPEQFSPELIARNLARKQRWNDYAEGPYSVAEHSVIVAGMVPPEHRLAALLHDAAEVVIGDIAAPVKRLLPDLDAIEGNILQAIGERFGVGLVPLPLEVKRADRDICATEARLLMGIPDAEVFRHFGTSGPEMGVPWGWGAPRAAAEFLDRLDRWTR